MGSSLGQLVGYSVRLDECFDRQKTKIKFMTEGILVKAFLTTFFMPNLKTHSEWQHLVHFHSSLNRWKSSCSSRCYFSFINCFWEVHLSTIRGQIFLLSFSDFGVTSFSRHNLTNDSQWCIFTAFVNCFSDSRNDVRPFVVSLQRHHFGKAVATSIQLTICFLTE